jgi:hypothetical protein
LINNTKNAKYDFNFFFLDKDNRNKFSAFRFYQFFTTSYLQNIYKINLKEKNINTIDCIPQKLAKSFLYKVRNINFKQFNVKYFNEVAHLFLVNL